jgi:autotransporter-associated beta strand protein
VIKAKRIRKNLSTSTILKAAVMATPAVLAIAASPARAANVYWDINGTTAGGSNATNATGAWDGTNAFWNTDAAGGAGTFGATVGAGNVGVFYAGSNTVAAGNVTGASTITVTGTQAASGLNFFTGTTTLTGGTIDFGGSAGTITMTKLPSPTVGGGGTINSVLTGTGGLTVNYVGTNTGGPFITLGAANTYSGNTVIDTRASVAVTNAAAFGTSSTITINGAVAQSGANSGLRLRSVGAMGAGQTLVLTGIGARTGEAQFTSETGNNTWAGNIVLQGPTSGGNNEGVGGLPGISQNAGSTLTITGTISGFATSATVAGNSFAKNGAGTLVLTTAATHVGLTRVFDGYMIIEADAVLGVGGGGAAQPSLGIGGDGNFEANTLMSAVSASARFPIIAFRNNVNYTTNEIIDMGLQSKIENLSGNNTFAGSLRSNQVAGNEIAITSGKLELTNRLYAAAATARTVIKSGPGELLITAANPTTDGVTMVGTTAAPMAQFAMTNTTFQVNDGLFTLGGANGSYPGPINVAPGGVLKLDNTAAANSTRIGGAVTLSGGELRLLGNATTAVNQPASSVSVASFSTISLSTAGASTTLAFPGALTRLNRGTAIIKGVDNTNTFLTLAGEPMFGNSGAAGTADINIGVSAIVENGANTDFMTVGDGSGTGNVRGLTSSEYTLLTTGSTSLVNTKLTGSQSLSSAETKANSVKMEGASTALTIGTGNILMLNSGAVLATGTGQGISGGDLFLGTYVFDPDFGYLPDQTREGVIAVTAGADLTISSAIKSEIGLTKTGTGLLVLTATNSTYAGQTTINAGILGVGHDGSLGAAATPVILNGGTLRGTDNANLNSAREVHLASTVSNVIDVVAGKTMTINGLVKNEAGVTPAPLSKTGSGTLKLTNAGNSYGTTTFGGTKVIGGTVEIADGAALGAQALFLDGGTVHVTANTTLPQILSVGNTSTTTAGFLIDPGVTVVESGVINQTGIYGQTNTNLVIDGGGTFNPTGNNNYASQTIVKGGSILKYTVSQGQGNSAFGVQPGWFTLDNGTIQAVGQVVNSTGTNGLNTLSVNKGITINSGGGTIDLQVGASTSLPYIVTVAGVVTGSGNLTKTGTGSNVLAFTSVNTMTGKVIINQGKITTSAGGTAPLFAGSDLFHARQDPACFGDHARLHRQRKSPRQRWHHPRRRNTRHRRRLLNRHHRRRHHRRGQPHPKRHRHRHLQRRQLLHGCNQHRRRRNLQLRPASHRRQCSADWHHPEPQRPERHRVGGARSSTGPGSRGCRQQRRRRHGPRHQRCRNPADLHHQQRRQQQLQRRDHLDAGPDQEWHRGFDPERAADLHGPDHPPGRHDHHQHHGGQHDPRGRCRGDR